MTPPRGRAPTSSEKTEEESYFPNLNDWSVTGEATPAYNCIGWSLCSESYGWVWPGNTVADFDALYKQHGWKESADCDPECKKRKIALFCDSAGNPTHAAKEAADGGWWESKKGSSLRIMHRLNEMEGGYYGNVCKCYEKADNSANLDLCPEEDGGGW